MSCNARFLQLHAGRMLCVEVLLYIVCCTSVLVQGLHIKMQCCVSSLCRLSTARQCDQIVVLEKGAVVEQGSHDVLLSRNGRYANMWEQQILQGDDLDAIEDIELK